VAKPTIRAPEVVLESGRQKVGGVQKGRFSTASVSPPILGEKRSVFSFISGLIQIYTRYEAAGSVQISLPKTGEGSGGVEKKPRKTKSQMDNE